MSSLVEAVLSAILQFPVELRDAIQEHGNTGLDIVDFDTLRECLLSAARGEDMIQRERGNEGCVVENEQGDTIEGYDGTINRDELTSGGEDKSATTIYLRTPQGKIDILSLKKEEFINMTLRMLKDLIQQKSCIPAEQQTLFLSGRYLKDDVKDLKTQGLRSGSLLCVSIRVCGGSIVKLFDASMLDRKYDYVYPPQPSFRTSAETCGGWVFNKPYGWIKLALKVEGKYSNDDWYNHNDKDQQWPVSYYGTTLYRAYYIGNTGYDIALCTRFPYGKGIYSSPDPNMAEQYAKQFSHEGKNYKVIIMNRVNKASTTQTGSNIYVTSVDKDVRQYAFLYKEF